MKSCILLANKHNFTLAVSEYVLLEELKEAYLRPKENSFELLTFLADKLCLVRTLDQQKRMVQVQYVRFSMLILLCAKLEQTMPDMDKFITTLVVLNRRNAVNFDDIVEAILLTCSAK